MLFAVDTGDNNHDAVYARLLTVRDEYMNEDLLKWNEWSDYGLKIGYGGNVTGNGPYSSECPWVYYHQQSGYYYLFRTQHYSPPGQEMTTVFAELVFDQ